MNDVEEDDDKACVESSGISASKGFFLVECGRSSSWRTGEEEGALVKEEEDASWEEEVTSKESSDA